MSHPQQPDPRPEPWPFLPPRRSRKAIWIAVGATAFVVIVGAVVIRFGIPLVSDTRWGNSGTGRYLQRDSGPPRRVTVPDTDVSGTVPATSS